jgi:formylglycine-generating enzyme required for sulfatase activity
MKTCWFKRLAIVAFATLGLNALAAEISHVSVRQRWPWSRLVDIDYVLCDATQAVDVAVTAYNGSTPLTLPDGSFSGDLYGVSADGTHRIVWDPTQSQYTNEEVLSQFRVTLTPTPSPLYMVIDLSGGPSATAYPVSNYVAEADVPGGVTNDLYKTTSLLLRRIPANTFLMGDSVPPTLSVTLTKAFYAGVYEVTQRQWQQVMGDVRSWPSSWNNTEYRDTRPVEQVSYYDIRENPANSDDAAVDWPSNSAVTAISFMGRVRAKTGIEGFDLPTEAQWECLCRAGTQTYYSDGISGTPNTTSNAQMDALGRYQYNGGKCWNGASYVDPGQSTTTTGATATVGSYLPNAWGLYDTHGNVWEWCRDWYTNSLGTAAVTDPAGADSGLKRVVRGGGWDGPASNCRSAYRNSDAPSFRRSSVGFRLFRTVP